ncbi:hypothetical protein TSUD_56350 [Trifolium subterraneum]|uniref:Neprosin PEP catalytic domain-containing protein n=1 Tax=Trifolium subterraneum TaxID=3900 RepID=A0A2Z6NWA5_TRISU|nr:hypothetical protein TSUD_56350 [Trifolium subterraneum]
MVNTTEVAWGGSTITPASTSSPPMGSGHSPDKNFVHASYFRYVGIQVDYSGKYYDPDSGQGFSDDDNCYRAEYYGDQGEEFGHSLQFGGPGCDQ